MISFFATIQRGNDSFLGLRLGQAGSSSQIARLFAGSFPVGTLVQAGALSQWRILGITEYEGAVYLYGPLIKGRPLLPVLRERGEQEALGLLERLGKAWTLLNRAATGKEAFYPAGVLCTDEGGLLVLPEELMAKINSILPVQERLEVHEQFCHPDRRGEAAAVYGLAALAYWKLIGKPPYSGSTIDELRDAVRMRGVVPPLVDRPELGEEVSKTLAAVLDSRSKESLGLEKLLEAFKAWKTQGVTEDPGPEVRAQRERQRELILKKDNRRYQWVRFWGKHWKVVLAVAVVVALAGSVAGSILSNVLAPRSTQGFSPEQVVRAFYTGINTFDHQTMEDCVVEGAGKGYINEAINLFVISRMRLSVEQTNPFVDAQAWDEAGRPELPKGKTLYGVARLELEPLPAAAQGEEAFTVTFERWGPSQAEQEGSREEVGPQQLAIEGTGVAEEVFLRRDKEDWVIYRIDRLSAEPLGTLSIPQ